MFRLAEFRQLEQKLVAQLAELEAMKSLSELQNQIEFETKLRDLLNEYGYSLWHVINVPGPQSASGYTQWPLKKRHAAQDKSSSTKTQKMER